MIETKYFGRSCLIEHFVCSRSNDLSFDNATYNCDFFARLKDKKFHQIKFRYSRMKDGTHDFYC